jgi:ElaB/YqjD/DUF883 family membrane-anchored ribosome-binding protein
MNDETNVTAEAERILENAQALLSATAHIAEEKVVAARNRLAEALEDGQDKLAHLRGQATDVTRAVEETVREYPIPALVAALGVGALLGFLLCRRN